MSLTEIMSAAQLWVWPTMALVLFLLAFAMILYTTFRRGSKPGQERAARLPLEDDTKETNS